MPRRDEHKISAAELRAALRSWAELRLLLMAREPARLLPKRGKGSLSSLLGFLSAKNVPAQAARAPAAPPAAPWDDAGRRAGTAGASMSGTEMTSTHSAQPPAGPGQTCAGTVTAATMSAEEFF